MGGSCQLCWGQPRKLSVISLTNSSVSLCSGETSDWGWKSCYCKGTTQILPEENSDASIWFTVKQVRKASGKLLRQASPGLLGNGFCGYKDWPWLFLVLARGEKWQEDTCLLFAGDRLGFWASVLAIQQYTSLTAYNQSRRWRSVARTVKLLATGILIL